MTPKRRKSLSWPVIMYPEGIKIGKVTSGKNPSGKVRHVAFTKDGSRIGTFDTFNEAEQALTVAFTLQQVFNRGAE